MLTVITHLTRMQVGFVCIAGIDPSSNRHVRPVVAGRRLRRDEIQVAGREIGIGTEIDIGAARPVPNPPEVEDHEFSPHLVARTRELDEVALGALLGSVSKPTLRDIFGPELEHDGATASVAPETGQASLGTMQPATRPSLLVDGYNKVKLRLDDSGSDLLVTVADLRLYEADQKTPDRAAVAQAQRALALSGDVYLSVGLSRPFSRPGESRPRHWLQINNLHVLPP